MDTLNLHPMLRQELKITPQLLQSMEVLQMNSQELLDYLDRVTEENPLLETEEAPDLRAAYEELRQKASWLDGGVDRASFAHEGGELPERGGTDRETDSLSAFLRDQLERKRLAKPLLALSVYLAELVDENGWLAPEDLESLSALKLPPALVEQALDAVQSLDPPGVGARDLSECLLLQLARRKDVSPAVMDIAARFLPELGRRHYGLIARELKLTVEAVQAAEAVIAKLDPHPGQTFQPEEPTVYVRPDVFIVEAEGKLRAVLNEYYLPRVSVNGYYARLLKESDEEETKKYLQEKMQQAKWLLSNLARRGSTLRRCAEAVLAAQRPFFSGETAELAPMKLTSLADALELHPSTVSRALRGKYLQCRQGTWPLRYFFSRSVGAQACSQQAVKLRIAQLIRSEAPERPLSDEALRLRLEAEGIAVARRTVAKYRMDLRLPSAAARRRSTVRQAPQQRP